MLAATFTLATKPAQAVTASSLTLKFYNASGTALTFAQVQSTQKGPASGAYESDAFVNPTNLQLMASTPLTSAGALTFPLPSGQPAAFAINWPTTNKGFGLVIVDNGGAGFTNAATVNFTYQAASDLKRRLDAALATRPDYTRTTNFNSAYAVASNCLATANATTNDSVRGAQGQLALEQLVAAYDTLLREYGPTYARTHASTNNPPWLGFTMEDVGAYQSDLNKLAAMAGQFGWVRIVFDPANSAASYAAAVNYAKSKGIKVLACPVDSTADTSLTRAQNLQRFKDLIAAFPTVDAWEVGNEVNGGWSSSDIGLRVADVAAYCKSVNKKTYLTLFWQLNTSDAAFSMFNWIAANLPAATRANLDYVGISQYQEQAPMGAAFDAVMRRLQVEFPNQKIGLGELGYWIPQQQYWWAYSATPATAKEVVLDQYYKASLGYAGAHGGGFWWNFASTGGDYDFTSTMTNTITALKNLLAAPPACLSVQPTNGQIKISWSTNATNAVLESSPMTASPRVWSPIATNQYQTGGTNVFFYANPASGNFVYRLRQP
ncbi:MAG: hypothetical protein RL380_1512 [Verrucomicrobiota bacterium]